jgi:hypothetical protein
MFESLTLRTRAACSMENPELGMEMARASAMMTKRVLNNHTGKQLWIHSNVFNQLIDQWQTDKQQILSYINLADNVADITNKLNRKLSKLFSNLNTNHFLILIYFYSSDPVFHLNDMCNKRAVYFWTWDSVTKCLDTTVDLGAWVRSPQPLTTWRNYIWKRFNKLMCQYYITLNWDSWKI